MILVVSDDKDFAGVVCEQVSRELKLPCETASHAKDGKYPLVSVKAIVSDRALREFSVPVIVPKNKPLRLGTLLAEVVASLQQSGADEPVNLGEGYVLLPRLKQVRHASGKTADVTDKEIQLLSCLHAAGKKGMDKDALLKRVWGIEGDINTHTLETHIYRLRGKLRELAGDDELISAQEGSYRLEVG